MTNFRKANINDLDRIAEIYDEIHTDEETGNVTIGWVRSIYPTRETARSSILAGDMFVEEYDGYIVAAAKINKEQVAEYSDACWEFAAPDDEILVLHTLVVSTKVKGKGFGTGFVEFYEDHAVKEGCRYLRMDTNVINSAARSLYKKLGYKEVSVVDSFFNGIAGVRLVCLEKKLNF